MQKRLRRPAGFVILGMTIAFLAIVTWLHVLRRDVDPLHDGVSRYGAGRYGYAVSVAFSMLALALAVSAGRLANQPEDRRPRSGPRSLWIASTGLLVVVLFPLRSSSPGYAEYVVHQVGGAIFFVAATIGVQGVAPVLRGAGRPAWLQSSARACGLAATGALILFTLGVVIGKVLPDIPVGLLQRFCLAALSGSISSLGVGLLVPRPANTALHPTAAGGRDARPRVSASR